MWCLFVVLAGVPSVRADDTMGGLEQALQEIQTRFPAEITSDRLYKAALDGVAQHLGEVMGTADNRVLTKGEFASHMGWMQGKREGIGAEFSILSGRGLLITEVFAGGPADQEGLSEGDLVVSMDGQSFTGLRRDAIHRFVRNNQEATTDFGVRNPDGAEREVEVRRGAYELPPIRSIEADDQTPVVRIPFFGEGTAAALQVFLAKVDGASAVIIDLRDSEGGALEEVVKAADLFLEAGDVVVHKGRNAAQLNQVKATSEPLWNRSVVVLINRGTRGISEAFASALSVNGRCMLVGTQSGGRALDTSVYPAGRGFVLQVADTHLSAPNGVSWARTGIEPNVMVEPSGITIPVGPVVSPPDLQRETAVRLLSTGTAY